MNKSKKKEYYFFIAYQVYSKEGKLIVTGSSFEGIETNVDNGEYEHYGYKELIERILNAVKKINPLVNDDSVVIPISINELSKDFWYQMQPLTKDNGSQKQLKREE